MYNFRVVPRQVDALLARKPARNSVQCQNVKSRTIWGSVNSTNVISSNCESKIEKCNNKMVHTVVENDPNVKGCNQKVNPVAPTGGGVALIRLRLLRSYPRHIHLTMHQVNHFLDSETRVSVNTDIDNDIDSREVLIYNVNGVDDKFASSILHAAQFKKVGVGNLNIDTEIHKKWPSQSNFDFGYIPIDEQLMPRAIEINEWEGGSLWDVHGLVRATIH